VFTSNKRRGSMKKKESKNTDITRRDFMKKTGAAAAAMGVSAFAPRLVKPAFAAKRDHILIGRPNPSTGPLAGFGEPTPWADMKAVNAINEQGGVYIKEYGKKLPIKLKVIDTESNPTKAAELSSRLILHDKVDLMVVLSTPDVVNPVCATSERFEMPCISLDDPAEPWLAGGPYKWCYHAFWSLGTALDVEADIFDEHAGGTNKVVGGLWANDPDGLAWVEIINKILPPRGYKIIDPGRFPYGVQDWTSIISLFKKEKVEILEGEMITPDWVSCYRQMHRHGFIPKIASIAKPLLFPADVNALGGNLPNGLMTLLWWRPHHPYKSSITGETARELCDVWEKETGKQWNMAMGFKYAGIEIAVDTLKRAQSLDKRNIIEALAKTNLNTIVGPIKYNKDQIAPTPLVGCQWQKGKKWPWDLEITYNKSHPEIPKTADMIFPIPR